MSAFNWLHLTDFHFALTGHNHLWPEIRERLFEDLEKLYVKCGPWQAVLFSGDLVHTGSPDEFVQLEEDLLEPLWDNFGELGCDPVLLPVPGNHDLQRPDLDKSGKLKSALRWLLKPELFHEIADEFFEDSASDYRRIVEKAFTGYSNWWDKRPHCGNQPIDPGLLPGDFSTTFELDDGRRLGVVALNTTYLQLAGGDYKGRLALDVRQFHGACKLNGSAWVKDRDICLLMTHQGPDWLSPQSQQKVYAEINPAGRFAVHLFGHMHEEEIGGRSYRGGPRQRLWQGSSLFGLEHYGDQNEDRRHGYSAGSLEFHDDHALLRHWPRKAIYDPVNGWRCVPDTEGCVLEDDGGTRPERTPVRRVPQDGFSVFISYAHLDNEISDYNSNRWLNRLQIHLAPLQLDGKLSLWSDQNILPGSNWKNAISNGLFRAKAAILLVSPAFLASDFIRNSELPVLLKKAENRGVTIIMIVVRQCLINEVSFRYPDPVDGPESLPLSTFQAVNSPDRPLNSMQEHEQDALFLDVAKQILSLSKSNVRSIDCQS